MNVILGKYKNGEDVKVGDIVLDPKRIVKNHEKDEGAPLMGEVVPSCSFFQTSSPGVCVVYLRDNKWGFHNYASSHLPRRNGGFTFRPVNQLKLVRRGRTGESVFDPIPKEEKEDRRGRRGPPDDDDARISRAWAKLRK